MPKTTKQSKKTDHRTELDPEARERLEGVLDPAALDEALEGLDPDQIAGPGGLLTQLAGRVISAALEAEMEDHLGRPHGTPAPDGNHRNGQTQKDARDRRRRRRDRDPARPSGLLRAAAGRKAPD